MDISEENIRNEMKSYFKENLSGLIMTSRIENKLLPILMDGFNKSGIRLSDSRVRDAIEDFFSMDGILSFIKDRQPYIEKISENVVLSVKDYISNHFPGYDVLSVMRKSNMPEDQYLYMVIAKNNNGDSVFKSTPYACWSCWNQSTESLNYGHYNLPDEESCRKILGEQFNDITEELDKYGMQACEVKMSVSQDSRNNDENIVPFRHKAGR